MPKKAVVRKVLFFLRVVALRAIFSRRQWYRVQHLEGRCCGSGCFGSASPKGGRGEGGISL